MAAKRAPHKRPNRKRATDRPEHARPWEPISRATMSEPLRSAYLALTPLQQRFVACYMGKSGFIGVVAAKDAGLPGDYDSLAARASQLRHHPDVDRVIRLWGEAYGLKADEFVRQLVELSQVNPGPFAGLVNGWLSVKGGITEDTWQRYKHWIKEFEVDPESGMVTRVKLHDAVAVKNILARIFKLYSDAPQVVLNLQLQQMPDDELLTQMREAKRRMVGAGRN